MKLYESTSVTASIGASLSQIRDHMRSGPLSAEGIDVPPRVSTVLRGIGFAVIPKEEKIQIPVEAKNPQYGRGR